MYSHIGMFFLDSRHGKNWAWLEQVCLHGSMKNAEQKDRKAWQQVGKWISKRAQIMRRAQLVL